MDIQVCVQCGVEIDGKGVRFQDRVFCGDECCDEFEEEYSVAGVPLPEDLEDEEDELLSRTREALGYREEDDLDEDPDLEFDDDFASDDDF